MIERYFVVQYMQALNQIKTVMNKFNVHVEKQSLFFLLSRTMSGAIVPFEGKPLHGLQIMGVLETRSLDLKYHSPVDEREGVSDKTLYEIVYSQQYSLGIWLVDV